MSAELLADAAAAALVAYRAAEEEAARATSAARAARDDTLLALHGAGWSVRRIAAELELSSARVGQLLTAGRARREAEWADAAFVPSPMRSAVLDDYRAARHAQELREEAYSGGGREERAAFYGRLDAPTVAEAERAITYRDWLDHSRQEQPA
jgi:hypothetical protein